MDGSKAKKVSSGPVIFAASVFPFQLGWSELVAQPGDLSDIYQIYVNIVQLGWSEPG